MEILMYSAEWCGDCRRSKALLDKLGSTHQLKYTYIDIEADPAAAARVIEINGGMRSIPVICFPDGTHLTEPSDNALREKLIELKVI
ncbi:MAG: NrdH-redoxin [Actinobacteria bacterium]|nr:NrdH-redoxin [Actinomycetota bacterium]